MSNRQLVLKLGIAALALMGGWSCEKTASISYAALDEYLNLSTGKYIVYRLDSTLYINFGQKDTVIKYLAKDVVEAPVTDNSGKQGWRMVRYLSDTTGTQPWVPNMSYMVFPQRESFEVVERVYRFTKLKIPIREGYSWKGNSYIDTYTAGSVVRFLDNWDYTYESINQPFRAWNNKMVAETITVNQRDETLGSPNDASAFSERTISSEVYGKGIGLIYKNFLHWEYQPPIGTLPSYRTGYGIRLHMVDHN
jgi:hypothetical protein